MAIPHVNSTPTLEQQAGGAVVVVDPISTGAKVASELVERGTDIICVWSEGRRIHESHSTHLQDTPTQTHAHASHIHHQIIKGTRQRA